MGSQEPIRKRLVLAQEAQQQVLGLYIGTAELARLISREEDNSARFLGVSFKHKCHRQDGLRLVLNRRPVTPLLRGSPSRPSLTLKPDRILLRIRDYASRK